MNWIKYILQIFSLEGETSFTEFMLAAHTEDARRQQKDSGAAGLFSLVDAARTRFSDHCANTVIQTTSDPLYKVQVGWTAPSSSNNQPACLLLTGTIMASPKSSLLNTKIHSNNPPLPEIRILRSPAPVSSPSPNHQFENYSSPTNDSQPHQTNSLLSSFTSQSILRLCQSLQKR